MGSANEDRKRPLEKSSWEGNCWKSLGEQVGAIQFLGSRSLSAVMSHVKVLFLESSAPCCLINVFNCCVSALRTLSWSETVILKQVGLHFFPCHDSELCLVGHSFASGVDPILSVVGWSGEAETQIFSAALLHEVRCGLLPSVYSMLALLGVAVRLWMSNFSKQRDHSELWRETSGARRSHRKLVGNFWTIDQ